MRTRIALLTFIMLIAVIIMCACGPQESTAQRCARSLGISYSVEEGATEHLDAFSACVARH